MTFQALPPRPVHSLPVVQHPADVLLRARGLAASALVAFASGDAELLRRAEGLAEGIEEALTPLERRALEGDPLEPAELSRLSWQTVSAAGLMWSIGRRQVAPPGDEAPDARSVIDGLIAQPELTGEEQLRPMADLREFARQARAWAWGTRSEQLVRTTGSTSMQQPVPDNASVVPIFVDPNAPPDDEELVVDGSPLRDVSDDRLDALISINAERLRAARWLLGETGWDSVVLRT